MLRRLMEPFGAAQLQFLGKHIGALCGTSTADQSDKGCGMLAEKQMGGHFEFDELVAPFEHVEQGWSDVARSCIFIYGDIEKLIRFKG